MVPRLLVQDLHNHMLGPFSFSDMRGLCEDTYPASAMELTTAAYPWWFFDVLSPTGLLGVFEIIKCHISLFTSFVHVSPDQPIT